MTKRLKKIAIISFKMAKAERALNILKTIIEHKKKEIFAAQKNLPLENLQAKIAAQTAPENFHQALWQKIRARENAVIAEIKKASPSTGVLRGDFDAAMMAKDYQKNGATCISVLTDKKFFQGGDEDLAAVRSAVSLPILRKDFIIKPYQIFESRALGADCILLILACLNDFQAQKLMEIASELGMDILVEVHNQTEMTRALKLKPTIIGINNRDLTTFKISLETTIALIDENEIPDEILIISESGIESRADVEFLRAHGVYGFLAGSVLMRAQKPGTALREIFR